MTTATAVDWWTRAMCRGNPDLWTVRQTAVVKLALHICRSHCPVLRECAAEATSVRLFHRHEVVLGGVSYGGDGRPTTRQGAVDSCARCLPLVPRGKCEPCGEPCDTPPVCRDCDGRADVEAAQAWREERP